MSPFDKAWSPYVAGILIGLLGSWRWRRGIGSKRNRCRTVVWRPPNNGCLPRTPDPPWLGPEAPSAIAASRRAGPYKGRGGMPAVVLQRALDAKKVRPVAILEARAGFPEPAFRAIASLALSTETLFKRFGGGGSHGDTRDKRADEPFDPHGAPHVD